MEGNHDKNELLNQLKIDKSAPEPASVSTKTLIIIAVLSAFAGAAVVYFLTAGGKSAPSTVEKPQVETATKVTTPEPESPPENTTETTTETRTPILNASGYITARLVATVSAEVMGLITHVDVEEGMEVENGQVLARLDDSVAKVNLELAKAQVNVQTARLKSLNADLEEAQRVLNRVSSLETDNFSSEAEMTRARANLDKSISALATTKADIEVAKLQVAQQQEVYDNHTIRAPFAGVVTVKNAQPGEIVSPSSAGGGFTRTGICTIVDMASLEIEVDVNEAFIRRVYSEQKVIANLDAYPNWDIPASVIAIIPTADRAKATVRVRIKIEISDPRILPDMGVKVAFLK